MARPMQSVSSPDAGCVNLPQGRSRYMASGINALFSPHKHALNVLEKRLGLISGNLANATTPGYKARDIDFAAAMRAVANAPADHAARGAGARHLPLDQRSEQGILYRTPLQSSLDGNTVDSQAEKAAFADAAVRYESTLSLLSRRINGLRAVLKGD